jgi:hypothetical protein
MVLARGAFRVRNRTGPLVSTRRECMDYATISASTTKANPSRGGGAKPTGLHQREAAGPPKGDHTHGSFAVSPKRETKPIARRSWPWQSYHPTEARGGLPGYWPTQIVGRRGGASLFALRLSKRGV